MIYLWYVDYFDEKQPPTEGCYCVCHSSLSSCPYCEHCEGWNDVTVHWWRRQLPPMIKDYPL